MSAEHKPHIFRRTMLLAGVVAMLLGLTLFGLAFAAAAFTSLFVDERL